MAVNASVGVDVHEAGRAASLFDLPRVPACPRTDQWELDVVLRSQERLASFDTFLAKFTDAANPNFLVVGVLPVLFAAHCVGFMRRRPPTSARDAHALAYQSVAPLLVLLTADWLNAALKLPLQGDRPFWCSPEVRQFPMTCESSFGMPSGHCMGVSAFIADAVAGSMVLVPIPWRRGGAKLAALQLFAALLAVVTAVSRVHTGSHFPMQTVYGTLCGWLLAWSMRTFASEPAKELSKLRPSVVLGGAAFVAAIATAAPLAAIRSLEDQGVNTLKSVELATAACADPSALHRTTPPLVTLCRCSATALGALVGATLVAKFVPSTLPPAAARAKPWKGTVAIAALVAVATYAITLSPIGRVGGASGWRGGAEAGVRAFAAHVIAFGVAPVLASITVHGSAGRDVLKCN